MGNAVPTAHADSHCLLEISPCQSGASAGTIAALLAAAAADAQPAWAHQAPGFQSNGAITVRSLGGAYGGTENPTGVARSSQSAVTQPPTVIIQATAGGKQSYVTTRRYNGNLGGAVGANAKCQLNSEAGGDSRGPA
ncbi:Dyp-type peroxidase [Duganella sp. LjRoot269]